MGFEERYVLPPGDEFSPNADGVFLNAPIFLFSDNLIAFWDKDVNSCDRHFGSITWDKGDREIADGRYGSATGFLI